LIKKKKIKNSKNGFLFAKKKKKNGKQFPTVKYLLRTGSDEAPEGRSIVTEPLAKKNDIDAKHRPKGRTATKRPSTDSIRCEAVAQHYPVGSFPQNDWTLASVLHFKKLRPQSGY
jgi:hypothetical protein